MAERKREREDECRKCWVMPHIKLQKTASLFSLFLLEDALSFFRRKRVETRKAREWWENLNDQVCNAIYRVKIETYYDRQTPVLTLGHTLSLWPMRLQLSDCEMTRKSHPFMDKVLLCSRPAGTKLYSGTWQHAICVAFKLTLVLFFLLFFAMTFTRLFYYL